MSLLDQYQDSDSRDGFRTIPPPWLCDLSDEKDLCDYTVKAWDTRAEDMAYAWSMGRENLSRYCGFYYGAGSGLRNTTIIGGRTIRAPLYPKIGINITRQLVEQRVSKINKITPKTVVVPANDDSEDKSGAKVGQKIADSYRYKYDYRSMRTRALRRTCLMGESYTWINWNKNFGRVKKEGPTRTLPLDSGKSVQIRTYEREGDIDVRLLRHEDVVFLLGSDLGGVFAYGCIIPVLRPVLEVRADYPDKAEEIQASKTMRFSYSTLEEEEVTDHVTEYHVYIRSTQYEPDGMHWICTDKCVLQDVEPNPIPWTPQNETSELGNLPIERIVDGDIEGNFHGMPTLNDINPLQNQYDKLTSYIMRNIWLFAHPKFVVPRGGVSIEQLSAGSGLVVQSSGPFQPYVAKYEVISQDVFTMWREFPSIAGKQYGIFDHSQGKSPANARTASQLMVYDEQEEETREIIKYKLENYAIGIDTKVLTLASKNFDKGAKRVAYILGNNKMWYPEEVDVSKLSDSNVVRIEASSMLPENKYARVRTLIELGGMFPGVFAPEQVADALEISQHEKFIDYARMAVMAAESENEAFLNAKDVIEPKLYEDLITHWRIHAKMFQTGAFKKLSAAEQAPPIDHMRATEYLMFQQADQNPGFKEQLLRLPLFPLFFVQQLMVPPAPMSSGGGMDLGMSQMDQRKLPQLQAVAGGQG